VRYHVTLDPAPTSEPIVVDVQDLPSGALDVHVGGRRASVDVVAVGQQLSVIIDGRVVDLTTEGTPPDLGAIAGGHRAYVRVESERQLAADAARRGTRSSGEKLLLSPMPGRVVKVLVGAGDSVTLGQPLVVMEAMKMENEIRARTPGTVARVHVQVGDTVDGGATLITLS
jgi:biotin carboxyl carrier protein